MHISVFMLWNVCRIDINDKQSTWLTRACLHEWNAKVRRYSFSSFIIAFTKQNLVLFSCFGPLLSLTAFHLSRLLSALLSHVSLRPYSPVLNTNSCFLPRFITSAHSLIYTHANTKVKACTRERRWFSLGPALAHLVLPRSVHFLVSLLQPN